MGAADLPKQYLPLVGRTVIDWSLDALLERADCERIIVVLAPDDLQWSKHKLARHPKILTTAGGAERSDSVRAGLTQLAPLATEQDWVLVHDAARPCLRAQDLDRLLTVLCEDEVGGLLAAPVVDTLKRASADDRVLETVPRASLWQALTPQMFRYGVLRRALDAARESGTSPTDEAQAVEALGLQPQLVRGDPDNIKVTLPGDLQRAKRVLKSWGAT
jgi:2-C-methyl-D-erythritol 4-phosphate cytidylyltransferase